MPLIPEQTPHRIDVGKGHIDVVAHDPQFLACDGEEHQRNRPDDEGLARDPAAFGFFGGGAGLVVDSELAFEFGD